MTLSKGSGPAAPKLMGSSAISDCSSENSSSGQLTLNDGSEVDEGGATCWENMDMMCILFVYSINIPKSVLCVSAYNSVICECINVLSWLANQQPENETRHIYCI